MCLFIHHFPCSFLAPGHDAEIQYTSIIHRERYNNLFFSSISRQHSSHSSNHSSAEHIMCWIFSSRKHNLCKMYLKLGSVCEFPSCICSGSMGPWWLVSFKQQQMRLPFHMQAIQSHMHSPGQANLIMNEVVIGSYTCVVDHSCSYPNEVCVSGFNIW